MINILEKFENIEKQESLNIRVLNENEKITFHDIYNGYCRGNTSLDIWYKTAEKGEQKGKQCILVKKATSKNINQSQYGYQYLFIYNNDLFKLYFNSNRVEENNKGLFVSSIYASDKVKLTKTELTAEQKQEIINFFLKQDFIIKLIEKYTKQNNFINQYFEKKENIVNEIKEKLFLLSENEILNYIKDSNNYKCTDIEIESYYNYNRLSLSYKCYFDRLQVNVIYIIIKLDKDDRPRLTKNKKIELEKLYHEKLIEKLNNLNITVKKDMEKNQLTLKKINESSLLSETITII